MSTVALKKWGNSVGVRIPAALLKEAHLMPGELLDISLDDEGALVLRPARDTQAEWKAQFDAVADNMQDEKILEVPNAFDEDDWTW